MMSYPYIFSSAFGTVVGTLGSKYIGERDDAMYLRLGLGMIVLSLVIGGLCGLLVSTAAGDIMQLFTDDAPTIAIVRPTFKFLVPYIAASMVRSVMYGMAWAMQEFGWIAVIAGVGTATYVPMALYAKYALDDVTLLTLMEISLYAGLVRTALIGVLCLWYIPRKLARWKAEAAALDAGAAAALRLAGGVALAATKAGTAIQ
jgi:Na+-driven multidrug efflux pump